MDNRRKKSAKTFKVDKVRPRRKLYPQTPMTEITQQTLGNHVEAHSSNHPALIAAQGNAFVMAVHHAYADHYPLSISPDHIWLLICQGFARHMTLHGEVLRDAIVDFEDKKTLRILRPDFRRGKSDNAWEAVFNEFSQQIRQQIGDDLHKLLTPTFSTTTSVETVAYEVTMMEAMQPYFNYAVTMCGIPSITLEGKTEDWIALVKQFRRFRVYGLQWWIDRLEPILKQFAYARSGKVDRDFWQNMYKLKNGSGGPYITGWILKFFPYIGEASNPVKNPYIERDPAPDKWMEGLTMRSIPAGLSAASVKCDDGVNQWDASFIAGFFGISQDAKTATLRPEIGWAVRDETAVKEARVQQRLKLRQHKEVWMPQPFRIENKQLTVQFKDGVFYVGEGVLWERDGNLSRHIQTQEIDFNTWEKKEYANLLYAYNRDCIPDEVALTVIQTHESRMTKYQSTGSLPELD